LYAPLALEPGHKTNPVFGETVVIVEVKATEQYSDCDGTKSDKIIVNEKNNTIKEINDDFGLISPIFDYIDNRKLLKI